MRPGRPPIYGTIASERIVVRITPTQRFELKRVARAHGIGVAGVIRELIDERVERLSDVPRAVTRNDAGFERYENCRDESKAPERRRDRRAASVCGRRGSRTPAGW